MKDKEADSWARNPAQLSDVDWKQWSYTNLRPANEGLYITDFDAAIRRRCADGTNLLQFLEIKRRNATPPPHQAITMALIEKIMFAGLEALKNEVSIEYAGQTYCIPVEFTGFHLLQLSADTFANSTYILDGENVTATELIDRLNFDAT